MYSRATPICVPGTCLCVGGPHLSVALEVRVGGLGPGEFQEARGDLGVSDPEVYVPHGTG